MRERTEIFDEKAWYREKIESEVVKISDTWILNQIYRFIINITKEG